MGSSGAGKTTLMDVLALRKSSGEITGEVRLNGHLQDEKSFRRCTGYVEQFDTQTAQLTIRETCEFSAKLRLESTDPLVTTESRKRLIDQTLNMLELTPIQDLLVGTDVTGGLSFEQKKRLSIAVELVANPSILFLDEPTSGLDARAAAIVMRGLKRIALTGRAVCATIHQPSIAIFNSFDSLLLLKRGGDVVYHGDLGKESCNLIKYLQSYETTPLIQPGENPATWMLTTIGAGNTVAGNQFDYARAYTSSKLHQQCIDDITKFEDDMSDEGLVSFPTLYATTAKTQLVEVLKRTWTKYWRSPSYNRTRIIVAAMLSLLMGSVFISDPVPTDETQLRSRMTTIYLSFLVTAVTGMNSVLSFFEAERNIFYRHKSALMYDTAAVSTAYTLAEIPFLLGTSLLYTTIFYFFLGFAVDAEKFLLYYLFMLLCMSLYTYAGQMFIALCPNAQIAQGFCALLASNTGLFAGVLIQPQNIPKFWIFMYWLLPGHYILEGLMTTQFDGDKSPIAANPGSPFYQYLVSTEQCKQGGMCSGTAEEWVQFTFAGEFNVDNVPYDILYLVGVTILTRVITVLALGHLNYRTS
jgi:ABC-type multidrug transport system ATPase subunit/ABC-type multidrug transport system permease subunit